MKRNLDGVYFRMKQEDGSWGNTCFSDLTEEQRFEIMENKSIGWLQRMCNILANTIAEIGEQFDIIGGRDDD